MPLTPLNVNPLNISALAVSLDVTEEPTLPVGKVKSNVSVKVILPLLSGADSTWVDMPWLDELPPATLRPVSPITTEMAPVEGFCVQASIKVAALATPAIAKVAAAVATPSFVRIFIGPAF